MERIYAIKSNFEYNEYDNASKAMESRDWQFILIWNQKKSENSIDLIDFKFINKEETTSSNKIMCKDWVAYLDSIRGDSYGSFWSTFRYIAPDGKIRKLSPSSKSITGLINSMKTLVELGKFDSWEQYDTVIENNQLKAENENLKNQIEDLKIEIKELQDKQTN